MSRHRPRTEKNTKVFTISISPALLALINLEAALAGDSRSKWICDTCTAALDSKAKKTKGKT